MKIFRILISILAILTYAGCEDDRLTFPQVSSNPVELTITSEHPMVEVDLYSIEQGSFQIPWRITYKPEWLTITPEDGWVSSTLYITAITEDLLAGTYQDKITVVTQTNLITIPVTLVVIGSVEVQFTPEELFLNEDVNSISTTLKNFSNQPLDWQLTPSASYLSVTPASGSLEPNQSVTLTVNVNRSTLDSKVYSENLALHVNGLATTDLPVTISNLFLLEGEVVDAEYNRAGDNLILVTSEMKLVKVNPVTKAFTTVTLPLVPKCVSVGLDGAYAIVGHEYSITRVDIVNMQIEEIYSVSTTRIADVVLAPNNYAYVFPAWSSWDYIRCINLDTGAETLHTGRNVYGGTKAKLHPLGNYIYGANNGLSPSDAEKYNIQSGTASYLYDSPYHGDYYFSGDLWIADDGSKMYTRSRNIFQLSTDQSQDMVYAGAVPGGQYWGIKSLDHHSVANRVAIILFNSFFAIPHNEIVIYSADALNLMTTKPLSDFTSDDDTEGHYVFLNTAGTSVVGIFKLDSRWGVITFDVN
jgi:hypothetical protein